LPCARRSPCRVTLSQKKFRLCSPRREKAPTQFARRARELCGDAERPEYSCRAWSVSTIIWRARMWGSAIASSKLRAAPDGMPAFLTVLTQCADGCSRKRSCRLYASLLRTRSALVAKRGSLAANQWHRACIIAAVRTFNLDNVGTLIAEQYCAIRTGQMVRKVHNANSTHRSGHLTHAPSGQKSVSDRNPEVVSTTSLVVTT